MNDSMVTLAFSFRRDSLSHLSLVLVYISCRLEQDAVYLTLKVCIKESCNMVLQCGSMDDESFDLLVVRHPVCIKKPFINRYFKVQTKFFTLH